MGTSNKYKDAFDFLYKLYDLFESKGNRLVLSFCISGFVWFFLFTFGVFDFNYFSLLRRFYYTGAYSLFCLITLLINSFLIQDYVIKELTLLKSILWSFWFMFCIGLSNFVLTTLIFRWEEFIFIVLLKNLAFTLFLGLIIAPALMLVHYNFKLRKKVNELTHINYNSNLSSESKAEKESVIIQSDYKSNSFKVDLNCLLYIVSLDNYLDIYYLKDRKIHHNLIRNTLSALEKSAIHPALIRCHRSYIINISLVQSIKGNAGGYRAVIKNVIQEIPISRKYMDRVLSAIRE